MRSQTHSSPDDIDITSLWSVLKRSGPKVLATSAVMGLGTFGVLQMMPSKYASEAQIQIGAQGIADPLRNPNIGANQQQAETYRVDEKAVASQVVALSSRELGAKVAKALGLEQRPEFNSLLGGKTFPGSMLRTFGLTGPRAGETEDELVLAAYAKALRVFQVKDTRVIKIEFTSEDNELAANAANQLAELYQDWLRSQGVTVTEDASKWLRPQIEKLTKDAVAAEADVERFRSQANLFRGGTTGGGLNEQQLSDLSTEVTKVRAARSEAESRARSARELVQRNLADAVAEVQKSPVIQGLIAQRTRAEREKAEAETSLLPGHPRMKQLNANVTDLRRQVTKEATLIVEGLEKEAKALALREELVAKSLDEKKKSIGLTANDVAKLSALEGEAKAKARELADLKQKLEAAEGRKDPRSVPLEATIIDHARVSNVLASPKRTQYASLAAFSGLILGFAFVLLKEMLSGSRRGGPTHPSSATAGPAFADAPAPSRARAAAPAAATAAVTARAVAATPAPAAASAASASIETIAGRLNSNSDGQAGYRTVITGAAAGISTHVEAVDLADALAASGKQVVLVDWSFDGQGIAQALGLVPEPGLADLLDGRANFEDVIRRLPEGDVHVLPCGRAAKDHPKLEADRVNLVLDALDEAYDHIVVTGEHSAIRELFLTIQGRFDAGIVTSEGNKGSAENSNGMFLGFQVTDIDVIRLDRAPEPARRRKMQLARSEPEARA